MDSKVKAFLDTIAWAELGPQLLAESDNGYDVIVGSKPGRVNRFNSYTDHPRKRIHITGNLYSTAAGRYQILEWVYDAYKEILRLPDFSPASQDKIALRLILECRAESKIQAGKIAEAIHLCRSRWASLPNAGYGQCEHKLESLLEVYKNSLAKYASDRTTA